MVDPVRHSPAAVLLTATGSASLEAAIERVHAPRRDRSAWVTRARETPKRRAMSARVETSPDSRSLCHSDALVSTGVVETDVRAMPFEPRTAVVTSSTTVPAAR